MSSQNIFWTTITIISITLRLLTAFSILTSTNGFLSLKMSGWSKTWDDISNGGNPRWKVTDVSAKAAALQHIKNHCFSKDDDAKLNIVCPLAGDDSFVHHAWSQGHTVTAIELVPKAVELMRRLFSASDDVWKKEERPGNMILWTHESGTAFVYQGDVFTPLKELEGSCDAMYDKDSFGALDLHMRSRFCDRVKTYLKPGTGILYTEVKYSPGRTEGPPFHIDKEIIMQPENFGSDFDYVASLGELYKLAMPMQQTGHVLKRLAKK